MKRTLKFFLIVAVFSLMGCAGARQNIINLAESDVQNIETIKDAARNLLKTWPTYSGIIRGALMDKMADLPQKAVAAMGELDRLAQKGEWTDQELGRSIGLRLNMLAETVRVALKTFAPDVLSILPAFL